MSLALNTKHLSSFINEEEYKAIYPQVEAAHKTLEAKNGPGSDFLGWMYLPRDYDKEEFERIKAAAAKIREDSDVLVVAGIGGSYLGARAVIEAVKGMYHNELDNGLKIYFCGNSISPTYLNDIIALCKGKRFSINVISKSGTTTETSLAFRVLRKLLEDEMGVEEANKRIYATTDRAKGTLKQLADAQGWPTFVVPDDVGGRYSVLSAVGLLPIAAAGISIDEVMQGAADAMERFSVLSPDNDAYKYAAIRNILYRKGKSIEILECYEPNFTLMNEWYKQLFGESEGKDNKGLFPASCIFSTDLHSMGQFIQEGSRTMFETIVDVRKPAQDLFIEKLEGNFDGLNFLADQNMSVVNRKAMEGTILAHTDGGVPEVVIEVDDLSAYNVGYLIYFFWRACACSGYLLSVNPFNQPGVESYKKNMFALLGKPGYENLTAELEAKLKYHLAEQKMISRREAWKIQEDRTMIKLIVGTKGSGKTKAMIDMINDSVKTSKGNVVVVEKGMKLTYEIHNAARLIDLDEYKIAGGEMLYGFVAGLLASNYDITDLYIDGILKVLDHDINRLGVVLDEVAAAAGDSVKVTVTVSADESALPHDVKKYL